MAYTETTSVGWFSRLGGSFRGIGFGIVMILAGTALLWWNEGDFVATGDALNEAHAITQELGDISKVDSSKNGQLVHATGPAETKDILTDPIFGVSVNAVRLERKVEFYQWVQDERTEKRKKLGGGEETVTTYTYKEAWVSRPVNSSEFRAPNAPRVNRNFVIANVENFRAQATNVTFGAYRLPDSMISSISGAVPMNVTIPEEMAAKLNKQLIDATLQSRERVQESLGDAARQGAIRGLQDAVTGTRSERATYDRPRRSQEAPIEEDQQMIHVSGNTVVLSISPGVPQIGDVRLTFTETRPGTVSLLGRVNGNTFETFRASNGKTVGKLVMGTHSLDNMYGDAHSSNVTTTWILRLVGACLVIFGLGRIVAPLEVFASVIPLLGDIVGAGAGVVSFLLGLAWSLLIISIAWLRFRPIIGLGMIAVAVALIALLFFKGRSRKAAKPTDTPAPVEPA